MKLNIVMISPGPVLTLKEEYCKLLSREFNVRHLSTCYINSGLNRKKIGTYSTYFSFYKTKISTLCKLWFVFYCIIQSVLWRIKKEKINLVSAYDPLKTGLTAVICARITRAPCVTEVNGVYNEVVEIEKTVNPLKTVKKLSVPAVQKFVLKRSAGIKVLFPDQIKDLKIDTTNKIVRMFPNYVNINKFLECSDKHEKKQVLFAGFPFWIKGVDILISAYRLIAEKYNEWELKILGYYPDKSLFDKYIGNTKNISVHSAVMPSEMPIQMQQCAIFVLPSRTDALARVLIESMAAGKARIGSNVDGTPQLIRDGIDGLLFKSGDIEELALKMDLLMGDKKLRKKMGEAGRRRARLEFSEENYIKNIRKFYDDTIIKCA